MFTGDKKQDPEILIWKCGSEQRIPRTKICANSVWGTIESISSISSDSRVESHTVQQS